jgi:predicted RNA-binding Zn-ribbon protein involved in translation (DUF1610 family)
MTHQEMMACPNCGKNTLHVRPSTSHLLHLILTIVTVGFWLPVWFIIAQKNQTNDQCTECGGKVGWFGGSSGGNNSTAPTSQTHVKCPDCRELVLKEARVCKHCHCQLIPLDGGSKSIWGEKRGDTAR